MYSILHHENLIVPKKILLRIDDKDITFKGQHSYQGLLLLENSSLIKCSYLAEDEQHNLYAIKVYNFENDTSRQNFIKQLTTLKTVAQPFFPAIKELISEKDVPQVLVIEKFEGCLSLKVLLEEFQSNEDLSNKLFEGLIIHKLLIKLFDCLFKFEQIGEYHGFLNLSNLCIKPTTPLQQDYNMKTYLEAILEDFSIAIWDVEAHKYWEIVSLEPSIRKNSSLWKSILTKNGMVEAPEFDIHGQEISRLSIKYDVWMVGIVLLQIICFGDQRKSDLLQEFSKNLPQMNFQERSMILKEFIQDPLLYKLALLMFQDLNHRPLPSEIVQLDLFMQMKKLLDLEAKGNEASSLDIHLSYEVLLIGLSCNNPNIALNALTILLNQALDGKEVLLQIINDNTYSQIIAKLKSCQDDSKLIEMGIKFFIQVLGQGGRRVANIFKASGIMSLVLRCIENDFDPQLLCQLFQHFGSNSTETFIHFVEKSGFVNKIIHYLKSENNESNNAVQKQFYLKTSHFYKLATLLEQSQFLSERELFLQLLKIPVVRRPDLISLKVIKKLLTHYGAAYIDQPQVNELALESFYQTLFSWMFLKNIVIYTSCHSQCIAALLLNDMSVPYESGFHCKTCSQVSNTNVFLCIKCASHCHVGHVISGLGYQYFTCSCESVTTCKRRKPEPIPNYLLNQNENYLDTLKISFNKIPKNFKAEIGKNIFLNTNGEIGTIITSIPLCSISSNINHNRFGTEKIIGYYEVEIKLGGFYDQNAVGFTTDYLYPKDEFAGYIENSIAYHGDDGAVYLNGNVIAQLCGFGSYDVIGCGITNFGTVYLTHNGVFLAEIQTELLGPIFPIVSLRGRYSSAQVNFEGNFMFNYEELKDNISEGDYIKFLPPSMIESLYFHPEWLEIFKKLDKMKPCDWLTSMLKTMTEKKEQSVQPNKEGEKKENENIQLNTIGEKDIDVIKELQSIDTMLREGKKSVKEFTSTRDYEIMRSLVQESNTISGNDRNISLNNENNYYNNSKSITGLGLRDTNMNEHLSLPMKSEKYLAAIPEKPVKEKKSRKNGLCHCNSENNKTKKGCEMF